MLPQQDFQPTQQDFCLHQVLHDQSITGIVATRRLLSGAHAARWTGAELVLTQVVFAENFNIVVVGVEPVLQWDVAAVLEIA